LQWWASWDFGPGSLVVGQTWSATWHEISNSVYYIQMPITLAKGVTVTPEVGRFDEKEYVVDGQTVDDGNAFYYGAYWRIDF